MKHAPTPSRSATRRSAAGSAGCIVTHGGAGSDSAHSDGCAAAAAKGAQALLDGASAVDAAVEAVVVLEDDPRFNAGTGSVLCLDGKTIEMDSAVMDSDARIGAVAAIRRARNPVRVARRVMDTPHILLVGEGADSFAARAGLGAENPPTKEALAHHERLRKLWAQGKESSSWNLPSLRAAWNFPTPIEECLACDTVGAVIRDARGRFAAASSTGGTAGMILGRVGDSPLPGCGYWAGPRGAVTATGIGEEIARVLLSKTVYDWIARGVSPERACARGVALFPREVPVGLIALSRTAWGKAANRKMAAAQALSEARRPARKRQAP